MSRINRGPARVCRSNVFVREIPFHQAHPPDSDSKSSDAKSIVDAYDRRLFAKRRVLLPGTNYTLAPIVSATVVGGVSHRTVSILRWPLPWGLWSTDTSVYALDIHGSAHAVNMPMYMREWTGSRPPERPSKTDGERNTHATRSRS